MSGDKDKMIAHLEKCERRMLVQFAQIREVALTDTDHNSSVERIVEMCDVYVDKRSDRQKMQDQIDELQKRIEQMEGDSE
tara:strand:+ start:535 stop:774 length:240 start_codon:yes stop_codon:yes gene_type:complete